MVLVGGSACTEVGLRAAARLSAHGVRVMTDTFVARQPRGAGRFAPDRMAYLARRRWKT